MGFADVSGLHRRHLLQMGSFAAAVCLATPLAAQDTPRPSTDEGVGTVWWVELVSSNDGVAIDYYKSTLAWGAHRSASSGEVSASTVSPPYTIFEAGGSEVAGAMVALKSDPAKNRPLWIVYFRVENVEQAIARALAFGGKLLQVPYDVPGSARMAVLADLDGTPFGVAAPLQP
jgi:uncharacterized protein